MLFRRLRCSFCRRPDKDVTKLVAGPRVYICDRCAHEVIRIMDATPPVDPSTVTRAAAPERSVDWARTWHFTSAAADPR
jgi:ATP-dependent Clp protease ATP-binding subunit ClpX